MFRILVLGFMICSLAWRTETRAGRMALLQDRLKHKSLPGDFPVCIGVCKRYDIAHVYAALPDGGVGLAQCTFDREVSSGAQGIMWAARNGAPVSIVFSHVAVCVVEVTLACAAEGRPIAVKQVWSGNGAWCEPLLHIFRDSQSHARLVCHGSM